MKKEEEEEKEEEIEGRCQLTLTFHCELVDLQRQLPDRATVGLGGLQVAQSVDELGRRAVHAGDVLTRRLRLHQLGIQRPPARLPVLPLPETHTATQVSGVTG